MSTISASTTSTTAYKVTADTTGTLVLQTGATPTTAVTIDGSQNVGVGVSPTYKFDSFGTGVFGSAGGITLTTATNTVGIRGSSATTVGSAALHLGDTLNSSSRQWAVINGYTAQGALNFLVSTAVNTNPAVSGSVAMTLDTSGNLLVGTTSNSLGQSGLILTTSYSAQNASGIAIQHASGSASGNVYAGFIYNGAAIGSITQNGTTGVLYNLTSDYRLKNNPTPVTGAKEFVMALQPKTWDWWDGSGKGVGFIAHEFMEVAKYSGHGEKDAVDEEGNIIPQSIQPSSSEVMANLVALIQEQQAIIEQLKADVAALKGAA